MGNKNIPTEEILQLAHIITTNMYNEGVLTQQSLKETFEKIFAYFFLYGYLPLKENDVRAAAVSIVSTPWVGRDSASCEDALKILLEKGIIAFNSYEEIKHAMLLQPDKIDPKYSADILLHLENARRRYDERLNLQEDLGWKANQKKKTPESK